ncbi:MAG TPA: class I SAM-dependent methyltransferase [Thermoanaerobaculia bacterium]|nr:class I SAM-dependent methyltransferase [Thermoanaerobaculia bacterium]
MSWFSFRTARREAAHPIAAPVQAGTEPEIHRSLALPTVFAALARGPRANVLDLGTAIGSNVEHLSEFGCRLSIEDLFMTRMSAADGEQLGPEFFEQLIPLPNGPQFDVVFAWDLFNYLTRKELAHLTARLRQACRPGAQVLALIWYHKSIPAQPIRFRFHGTEQLVYDRRTALERPGPRFQPAEINQLMSGFHVDRSFLLRHGIQEYLFVRE